MRAGGAAHRQSLRRSTHSRPPTSRHRRTTSHSRTRPRRPPYGHSQRRYGPRHRLEHRTSRRAPHVGPGTARPRRDPRRTIRLRPWKPHRPEVVGRCPPPTPEPTAPRPTPPPRRTSGLPTGHSNARSSSPVRHPVSAPRPRTPPGPVRHPPPAPRTRTHPGLTQAPVQWGPRRRVREGRTPVRGEVRRRVPGGRGPVRWRLRRRVREGGTPTSGQRPATRRCSRPPRCPVPSTRRGRDVPPLTWATRSVGSPRHP